MAKKDFKAKLVDGVSVDLSDAEIDECVAREEAWAVVHAATSYIGKRQAAYPQLEEQLDQLFHDMTAGKGDKTGNWYAAIAKVKSDNPKPE